MDSSPTAVPVSQPGLGLAEVVQRKRWALGLSRRALGAQAGLSEAYVGRLESGAMVPGLKAFALLAVELRLTMHELYIVILEVARQAREDEANG